MIGRLLCRMGRHDPDPTGRWNGGYCFTACRRCGRDMVRSAFGEWHIPRDYRIVWGPAGSVADLDTVLNTAAAAPVAASPPPPSPALPSSRPDAARSPFDFGDFDREQAEQARPAEPAHPPAPRRRAPNG